MPGFKRGHCQKKGDQLVPIVCQFYTQDKKSDNLTFLLDLALKKS